MQRPSHRCRSCKQPAAAPPDAACLHRDRIRHRRAPDWPRQTSPTARPARICRRRPEIRGASRDVRRQALQRALTQVRVGQTALLIRLEIAPLLVSAAGVFSYSSRPSSLECSGNRSSTPAAATAMHPAIITFIWKIFCARLRRAGGKTGYPHPRVHRHRRQSRRGTDRHATRLRRRALAAFPFRPASFPHRPPPVPPRQSAECTAINPSAAPADGPPRRHRDSRTRWPRVSVSVHKSSANSGESGEHSSDPPSGGAAKRRVYSMRRRPGQTDPLPPPLPPLARLRSGVLHRGTVGNTRAASAIRRRRDLRRWRRHRFRRRLTLIHRDEPVRHRCRRLTRRHGLRRRLLLSKHDVDVPKTAAAPTPAARPAFRPETPRVRAPSAPAAAPPSDVQTARRAAQRRRPDIAID